MKKLFRYLVPYVRHYWKYALISVLLTIPYSAIKGVEVWLIKHFVNTLTFSANFWMAFKLSMSLLGLSLINYPCRFFHFYLMRYVIDRAACLMRNDIYRKLQCLPLAFFVTNKSGALVSNILNDTRLLADGLKSMIDLIREPLTAIVMLGMAFYSDWRLTLVILLVGPLFVIIFVKSGRRVRVNQEEVQEQLARMTHTISEGINGQKICKAFNLQDYIRSRFEKVQDVFFRFQMRTAFVEENAHPLVEVVGAIAFAAVILYAHHRISSGETTTGDFFSFVTALALMMDPLRKYSQANVRLNQARAAGERLFEIMKFTEEDDKGTIILEEFKKQIDFENVTFMYHRGEGEIIKNLSFSIRRGERVGIVGLSGAGKSTIISLLLRLYHLGEGSGKIKIDGIAIEDYTLESLRKNFGLVSQDLFLFHDSVRENLCVGKHYSSEQIIDALRIAGAKDFVDELPQGIETLIGDRGTRLSGGQCQRLTIARAVLRDPSVLLFDEATSALDNSSEKEVQAALDRWSGQNGGAIVGGGKGKTVLAVAHRLSTIQNYDQILVMNRGEIVEQGTHQQLMDRKGEYFRLYDLSMKQKE
ncbi:MAG: ATP-binding cassette domain-containing protein [Oligoflexia bacterium]|nr:ATP-binding cassette domain-containing protein [Oligoflexia bacterium]